ncbi:MAG: right-handed parallel beta-helix repeat-containing protein [Gemmatimonadota bacterium]|jgi:parallel beta-helix repeat protein
MSRSSLLLVLLLLASPFAAADEGRVPIPFAAPVATPIVIDSPGSYVLTRNLAATGSGPVIRIETTDVTLDLDGKVVTAFSTSRGIEVGPGGDAVIRNGSIRGGTDGVFGDEGSSVTIEDVHIAGGSGGGVVLFGTVVAVVRRAVIEDTGGVGIALEGSAGSVYATLADNVIRNAHDGICAFDGGSVEISNNRLREIAAGAFAGAIVVDSIDAALITRNTIEDTTGVAGIRLINANGATLENNLVSGNPGGAGIELSSHDCLVSGNVVRAAGLAGFDVAGDRNRIRDNVTNLNGSFGLRLRAAAGSNVVTGNMARGNAAVPGDCSAAGWTENEWCDDAGPATTNTVSGDNYMPDPF